MNILKEGKTVKEVKFVKEVRVVKEVDIERGNRPWLVVNIILKICI